MSFFNLPPWTVDVQDEAIPTIQAAAQRHCDRCGEFLPVLAKHRRQPSHCPPCKRILRLAAVSRLTHIRRFMHRLIWLNPLGFFIVAGPTLLFAAFLFLLLITYVFDLLIYGSNAVPPSLLWGLLAAIGWLALFGFVVYVLIGLVYHAVRAIRR